MSHCAVCASLADLDTVLPMREYAMKRQVVKGKSAADSKDAPAVPSEDTPPTLAAPPATDLEKGLSQDDAKMSSEEGTTK